MHNPNWIKGVTRVVYVPDLGKTPAAVNTKTGVILVSLRFWKRLSVDQKFFVLLHEWAHLQLGSNDEVAVDALAFQEYAKRGYRLSQGVKALTRLLSFTNREHYYRANIQLERAKHFDRVVNGNQKV